MKILFLDIDGVLNSEEYYSSGRYVEDESSYPHNMIDPILVERLNTIIGETDCNVVVSSTWRIGKTPEYLKDVLKRVGYNYDVYGMTPRLSVEDKKAKKFYSAIRGQEIEEYLSELSSDLRKVNEKINYCILDDDTDMLLTQANNFVFVDNSIGLSEDSVQKCIKILNGGSFNKCTITNLI